MKIPLVAVGSTPPRYMRGRTFLPDGMISAKAQWGMRFLVLLAMIVIAPLAPVFAAYWLWGLRRRMWRWYVAAIGAVSVVAALAGATAITGQGGLTGGIQLWKWVMDTRNVEIANVTVTGNPPDVILLLAGGWAIGTIVGCWMSFLAWWRTPPWRDRERPKTVFQKRHEHALTKALEEGAGDVDGVITFGIDTRTGEAVELPWQETEGHIFVTGAPGTGKTTSSMKVVRAAIRDGMFTAIVDMKGAPDIIEQVSTWCARWDRPLWVFSHEGPSRYDPFTHGDYTRKRDLLMATSQWTEEHYKAKASDYLLTVFYVLDILGPGRAVFPDTQATATTGKGEAKWAVGSQSWLHTVADMLNPNHFKTAVLMLPPHDPRTSEARVRAARVIDEAEADNRSLSGLGPRVRALTDTIMGQWIQPGEPRIDLMDIWNQGGVVIFSLPTLTYREAAAAFGGLAVQDLKTLAGRLQDEKNTKPGLVFVDEFSTLGAHNITEALAMARASKLRWMLATQDLGDLAVGEDGKAFVQKILTDTNVKIMHGVGDPETAERLAQLAGMKWGIQERTAINQSNSSIDVATAGTQSGHGFVDRLLVPAIEPNDILHQGAGADSTFTLINKPGMYAITGAHTVPDTSSWDDAPVSAPLYLPARYHRTGAVHVVPGRATLNVAPPSPTTDTRDTPPDDGWWD